MRFTVTALNLAPWPARQGELFERKPRPVQGVIDTIRDRFGAKAITLGEDADRSGRYTGLKIAFEQIPDSADFEWLGVVQRD